MYQNKPLLVAEPAAVVEAESNEPFNLQLELKDLSFRDILFDYRNDVSPMKAHLDLNELSGKVKSIDLAKLDVQLEEVKLHNTKAEISLGKSEQTQIVKEEINKEVVAQVNNPWKISIDNIDFENNDLRFDDDNKPTLSSGMDYGHMDIKGFTLRAKDMIFTPTRYEGNITSGSFKEKSGFDLREFKTTFAYSDSGAYLHNLYVKTDRSLIKDRVDVSYPSLEGVTKDMGKLWMSASLSNSAISVRDILLFAPQLQANLKGNEQSVLQVNGKDKYGLGAMVKQEGDGIYATLSDSLMLDYNKWSVELVLFGNGRIPYPAKTRF